MRLMVGVIGYSQGDFDTTKAYEIVSKVFDSFGDKTVVIVSGLTALGIPLIAYQNATERGWETMGIACSKANEYDCWPVDKAIIVGSEWGDESPTFLKTIDCLLKFGGGEQSATEFETFKNEYPEKIAYEFMI